MAEPTETITTTSNIPKWAERDAAWLLGQGRALANQGFQEYGGPMLAGFNPLQTQAFGDLAAMGVSPQLSQATGLAGLAGLRAQEAGQYTPAQAQQFYQSPVFGQMGLDYLRAQAAPGTQYQMGPAERVGAERFGTQAMQDYMSPYMQGVVEQQKQGAIRDYLKQLPGLRSSAARSGALGGSREAILESEARRGLAEQLGGIEATGLQQAYQQAASQFGQDRAAQMQAALANQAAGLTTGGQNLQALINQAQFGAGQGMQAQQLNQAAALQAQQQGISQQQALNQLLAQDAANRAQYGLAGAQFGEASRQFGAGLGMQGLQQQLAAAGALGGLGQQQYQQGLGISQAQLGAGAQIQALEQQNLANQYQQFINQQRLPYQQLEFFSSLLRGIPATGQTQSLYQAPGSVLGQVAGLATGIGSLFGGLGGGSTSGGLLGGR